MPHLHFDILLIAFVVLLRHSTATQGVSISEVKPNVSPLSGGVEVFITGKEFGDSVKAEFSAQLGVLTLPLTFVINPDQTRTASFIAPRANQTLSAFGSWVRIVDGHAYSAPLSFYWEDPVVISSVFVTPSSGRTQYNVFGSGFYQGILCASPIHTPVAADVKSTTELVCFLANKGTVYELILIQKSGATVSYPLIKTTGTTGASPTSSTSSSTSSTSSTSTSSTASTTSSTSTGSTTGSGTTGVVTRYGSATHLYAWAGAADRTDPDYVAIIDVVPGSPTYKKVVGKAELPHDLAVNNEPHHMQFINNNTMLVAGGLFTQFTRPQSVFFWNVSNPVAPTFVKADIPQTSSAPDEFIAVPKGGFLVTLMGAMDGSSPGAIGEWDANLNMVGEWPPLAERPVGFNPHGISLDVDRDMLITTDFFDPRSSFVKSPPLLLRDTIRIWKPWSKRRISATVKIPEGQGMMDIKFLPHNTDGLAYTTNFGSQGMLIWAINTSNSQALPVFNVSSFYNCSQRDFMYHSPVPGGTKWVVTNSYSGLLILFDIADPVNPILIDSIVFGIATGIHSIDISDDSRYVGVSGYFLDEDDFGIIREDGDRCVHIAELTSVGLVKTDFSVNLDTDVPYPIRPHMIRFYNTRTTTRPT
eukprot:TRINITY_DN1602_c0_g4_i1.p1 TRINITY_DN1602_c0_g4~~TRINITY_DN1602_c0_g4_i1.p1  ORF type:complete len:643 (+),score=143.45 TRINITY_DN1602_c0_g4_i1:74-2002(+)